MCCSRRQTCRRSRDGRNGRRGTRGNGDGIFAAGRKRGHGRTIRENLTQKAHRGWSASWHSSAIARSSRFRRFLAAPVGAAITSQGSGLGLRSSISSASDQLPVLVSTHPIKSVHQCGLDGAKMRHKCALGRLWPENQSVARRSWRDSCGEAAFGENASGRGYRVISMACAKLRESPSDGDLFQLSGQRTLLYYCKYHMRHSCATYATVRVAFQVGAVEAD